MYKFGLIARVLLVGLIVGPSFALAGNEPQQRYTMSSAVESGINLTWRLEKNTGRVSICLTLRNKDPSCSHWSPPGPNQATSSYMIGDNDSNGPSLWVWRMNTMTGAVSLCKTDHPLQITGMTPQCTKWEK